jgi:hypothetical protein
MLECQTATILREFGRARSQGIPRPFVLVGDVTDFHGRQLALFALRLQDKTEEEQEAVLREHFAKVEGVPTVVVVVPFKVAEQIMPQTSPTGLENVRRMEKMRRPGLVPVAVIARKGNLYALVPE